MSRSAAARIVLLAPLLVISCVSSTRYESAIREKERLARENLQLQRSLTEERVRAQEALEAASAGISSPAAQAQSHTPPPIPAADPGVEEAAASARVPEGLAGQPAAIGDEDIHSIPGGVPGTVGEDGILRVARSYASSQRPREAMDAYTRLIKDYPFSRLLPAAFLERGTLRIAAGDRRGALEDFDTVAEAFPASSQAGEARRQAALLRH